MRRRALITVAALTAALAGATVAQGELAQEDNLRVSFDGGFTPRQLPRDQPAPIAVDVEGSIATTDGSPPPVLKHVEIGIHRAGSLSFVGLPACTAQQLQSTTTERALERCRPALVGSGSFAARIDFPDFTPVGARGRILAFNGRARGKPALLLQLYAKAPVQIAFVVPLAIERRPEGQFGTVLAANLPTLGGGSATVTQIKLKVHRTYTYRGQRRSFLSASCAAPAGFTAAVFTFARGSFRFSNGTTISTELTRDCRVR